MINAILSLTIFLIMKSVFVMLMSISLIMEQIVFAKGDFMRMKACAKNVWLAAMIVLRRKRVIIAEMVFIWMKGSANVEKANISIRIANHARIAIKLSNFV